jgi:3-hydroxyisobutyrate dehydrogenase
MMRIGFVGLGNMGSALARRLLLRFPLVVFDLQAAPVAGMTALGAEGSAGLGDLAARCDVVLLCLPSSADVRCALFGDGGLVASARPGTLFIDQTTGDPSATRAMAAIWASNCEMGRPRRRLFSPSSRFRIVMLAMAPPDVSDCIVITSGT